MRLTSTEECRSIARHFRDTASNAYWRDLAYLADVVADLSEARQMIPGVADLIGWFGERMLEAADDKLVDAMVTRGDIMPSEAPTLKTAGPIYIRAALAELQRAQTASKS